MQLEQSDVISFHDYEGPVEMKNRIVDLQKLGRPVLCTEYMARGNNSTFKGNLPVLKQFHVAAWNWGLVSGKSNTIYPWDSWVVHYTHEPTIWFHDVFHPDGTPFSIEEVRLICQLTGVSPIQQGALILKPVASRVPAMTSLSQ